MSDARYLLVRLGAIGDVVNALVVANAIRKHRPEAFIGWAVHPLSAPLLETSAAVDRVHVWQRGTGLGGFRSVVRDIRGESYDVAVDLQRLQKSAILSRRAGAQRVLGFDRRRCKEHSWIWTRERIEPGPRREHMVLQYQRFLPLLGIPEEPPLRDLGRDAASEAWAEAILGGPCRSERPVLLNLGASKSDKLWSKESFRELAQALTGRPSAPPVVLVGGPSDVDAGCFVHAGAPAAIQLAGETNLTQLLELIRRSRGMVTADTGAMHMAAALDVPVVALFGPSDPVRTGPYGLGHIVLQGTQSLSRTDTVSLKETRRMTHMDLIGVGQVLAAAERLFLAT